jgi:hypothetical protein
MPVKPGIFFFSASGTGFAEGFSVEFLRKLYIRRKNAKENFFAESGADF